MTLASRIESFIEIRVVRPEEAPQFRVLRLRSLAEHPEAYHSTYADWDGALSQYVERIETNRLVGVFADNRLVGFTLVALQARRGGHVRHKCEFWSVYLAPEYRGRGLARRMLEASIIEARNFGFEAVVLSVNATNAGARRLYEALGFVEYGLEKNSIKLPDGRRFDDILMELRLD